jgi:hypothetical protein
MANIAPTPHFPERPGTVYEAKQASAAPGERGPLRFEEGLATDTDIPNEFAKGVSQGFASAPGRPNRNANVYEKPAAETIRERTHVGSAAWVEGPTFLSEFATGAFADYGDYRYEEVIRNGARQQHGNPSVVND